MHFKIGDKVKVIDQDLVGYITSIIADKVFLICPNEFEYEFHVSELVHMSSFTIPKLNEADLSKIWDKSKIHASKNLYKSNKKLKPREIDLHIQNLVSNYNSLTNYEMLSKQKEVIYYQLKKAKKQKEKSIIFIHGVGKGVLVKELHQILQNTKGIKFRYANTKKYGNGATEVIF